MYPADAGGRFFRPDALARRYLKKAEYSEADLEAVRPVLRAAEKNTALEKQFKGNPTPPSWVR